jgi:biopolymer transport protein ExbB
MTTTFKMVPVLRRAPVATGLRLLSVAAILSGSLAPLAVHAQEPAAPAAETAPPPPPAATPSAEAPAADAPASTAPNASTAPPPAEAAPQPPPADPTATAAPQSPPPSAVDQAQPAPAAPEAPGTDAAPAPVAQSTENPHLPHDLSPWNMFLSADIVVKAVMIGLAFASVVTWTVWLAKSLELTWAKRRLVRTFSDINASASLAEAAQRLGDKKGVVSGLIDMAIVELRLSADVGDKAGIKERVSSRLDGLVAAAGRDMNRGTGVLATIGSTSPFVGLFGTVWGIMNSFIGISESQTTNLAIVAPGIAEALLATAIGLVAAIPAVIIYNHFSRQIGGYKALIAEASAEVMRLVSRDLDRGFKVKAAARAAE